MVVGGLRPVVVTMEMEHGIVGARCCRGERLGVTVLGFGEPGVGEFQQLVRSPTRGVRERRQEDPLGQG